MRRFFLFTLIVSLFASCSKKQQTITYKPDATWSNDRTFVLVDSFDVSSIINRELFIPTGGAFATDNMLFFTEYGTGKHIIFDTLGKSVINEPYCIINQIIKTDEPDTLYYNTMFSDEGLHLFTNSPQPRLYHFNQNGLLLETKDKEIKSYIKTYNSIVFLRLFVYNYYDECNERVLVTYEREKYLFRFAKKTIKKRYEIAGLGWFNLKNMHLEPIFELKSYATNLLNRTDGRGIVARYDSDNEVVFFTHCQTPYIYKLNKSRKITAVKVSLDYFKSQYVLDDSIKEHKAKEKLIRPRTQTSEYIYELRENTLNGYQNCSINNAESGFTMFYMDVKNSEGKARNIMVVHYDEKSNTYFEQALIPESYAFPVFRNNRIYQLSPVAPQKLYVWELRSR